MVEEKQQIRPFFRVMNVDLIGGKPIVQALLKIKGIGFRYAKWECYDGTKGGGGATVNEETDEVFCTTSESLKILAIEFCENKCSEETGKCGVNSFGVSGECSDGEIEDESDAIVEKEFVQGEISLICKNSCAFGDSCLPIGVRTEGKYCNINGEILPQLGGGEQCDNNFECGSNVCVSGQCVETGLIQKILEWFRKLFGNGE